MHRIEYLKKTQDLKIVWKWEWPVEECGLF